MPAGSLADPTLPKIYIIRTGEKFPPHKYDPTASPDTAVTVVGRRNGQMTMARRVLKPTLVSRATAARRCFQISRMALVCESDSSRCCSSVSTGCTAG